MALSPKELSSTLKHLKRTPAPKVPVGNQPRSPEGLGPIDLSSIKLKKTGKRESLIETDTMTTDYGNENSSNELNSAFKKRLKMFEQSGEPREKPATLPRVKPKPRRTSEGDTEFPPKPRSESFHGTENTDNNGNVVEGTPTLKPLPTLQSIGSKPPPKPPKPQILSMKIQKKYKNHKLIIAPKVQAVIVENVNNGSFDQDSNSIVEEEDIGFIEDGEDIYDDINTAVPEIPRTPVQTEPEPIEEDMYDDVEQLAETVKAELGQNVQQQPPTGTGQGIEGENVDGDFGEDLYQPVLEGMCAFEQTNGLEEEDMPGEQDTPMQPPPLPRESKEDPKTKKEREKKEKESQKKKEKDEQRKKKEEERREREDKKKKEEERRRREKGDKDLKKVHKLKGSEPVLCKATAKEDITGNGKDLPCSKGSLLEVLVKGNCPSGKWLVKDQQGHYGYVPSELLLVEVIQGASVEPENLDEDLYECVDTFQIDTQPAPPPVSPLSYTADDFQEELYDDTVCEEDEDLYDDIPGAN